jgi:hypothetical protein
MNKDPLLGVHGKRSWDAPRLEERRREAAAGPFMPTPVRYAVYPWVATGISGVNSQHRRGTSHQALGSL